ncbi:MAG: adenosylcobalamin-dependent ribonucleoside-diphosphate reductase [Candidatus Levybacteria bacterium]|nr:adenosylcobalamin-dependent ribonucleoside-diphosphate reductase [Candidatus Levybacteria bacterium]
MKLDGIRNKVFLDRYALKGVKGELLEHTPQEMWKRVARGIAENEKKAVRKHWEKEFYNVMSDFKFVPGGRILSGAGTNYEVTYFNCFVIPSPKDSREGILESLKQLVEIQSRSGGVGLNLSSLRPRGARVKKVNGTSSGPVTWAGLFSYATHDVVQQGGTRRGATMLMLWDWHPDIEEFITVKQDLSKINGANLSVCVSDSFMEAVKKDKDWSLIYPDLDDPKYDEKWDGEIDQWKKMGGKIKVYKTIKARDLWNLICEAAWRSAEPGLHFLERSNKRSNTWYFEKLIATNPCGEQPLGPWAVCNLGAMNLAVYVKPASQQGGNGEFDYKNFGKDVKTAVRFLDNVIDKTYYFFKENEKIAKEIRRTGLGIMGLGDALIKMKVRYGSDESLEIIDKIFETLRNSAYEASSDIAREKGVFPKFNKAKYMKGYHIKELPEEIQKKITKQGIRNAVLLTIAPTGTTSLLSGVTSGIEPVYEFTFIRRDRTGEHIMYHPLYEEWKKENQEREKSFDSVQDRPEYFVSANDLTPLEHAQVQAVAQKYIDASISKTVNAPNAHTVEDVKTLYMAAYDLGLKGVTYMRDGSREGVLTRVEEKKEEVKQEKALTPLGKPVIPRPMQLEGVTYAIQTPVGKTYITINHDEKREPFEVFITIGKSGSDVAAMADALGRMISVNLRLIGGLTPRERIRQVVAQLAGIGGARSVGFGKDKVRSLPDAVAKILSIHFDFAVNGNVEDRNKIIANGHAPENISASLNGSAKNGSHEEEKTEDPEIVKLQQLPLVGQASGVFAEDKSSLDMEAGTGLYDICPECGAGSLAYEEGCRKCYSCGYSEC